MVILSQVVKRINSYKKEKCDIKDDVKCVCTMRKNLRDNCENS